MIQLIYVSSATKDMSEDEILDILNVSRDRNKDDGITGMLLYAGKKFFQVLEGEREKVKETYERIRKDERHNNIMLIERNEVLERSFPYWSMGFKYITEEYKDLAGYNDFMNRDMKPQEFALRPNLVVDLLYKFKSTHE